MDKDIIPIGPIEERIYALRGKRVMLDSDLADLYGVATKRLNEQVRRNADRFPQDFAFLMEEHELGVLRSQNATSNEPPRGRGGRRYRPWVFTEHGAIMAASVLNSPRAVEVSVFVVRALLAGSRELSERLDELERKLATHDQAIAGLIDAIRQLASVPAKPGRPIGFTADLKEKK